MGDARCVCGGGGGGGRVTSWILTGHLRTKEGVGKTGNGESERRGWRGSVCVCERAREGGGGESVCVCVWGGGGLA